MLGGPNLHVAAKLARPARGQADPVVAESIAFARSSSHLRNHGRHAPSTSDISTGVVTNQVMSSRSFDLCPAERGKLTNGNLDKHDLISRIGGGSVIVPWKNLLALWTVMMIEEYGPATLH